MIVRSTTARVAVLLAAGALASIGAGQMAVRGQESARAAGAENPSWAEEGLDRAGGEDPLAAAAPDEGLDALTLLLQGGWFMAPIGLMSLLVVACVIERSFGLRRGRVLPRRLVRQIRDWADREDDFDLGEALRACKRFPSATANVLRAMLLRAGEPLSEVERAGAEASEREAARMYAHVRWLNLAAAVTPLMGLLGTVWGMIRAFHDTTQLAPGQNKADYLAEGIYVALVTTLAGLSVAIPAAIFAHYFEGRVQTLLHRVEDLLAGLLPRLRRCEGRVGPARESARPLGAVRESEESAAGASSRCVDAAHSTQPAGSLV